MQTLKYRFSFLDHLENVESARESDSFSDLQNQGMLYLQEKHRANINGLSATFLYIYPNYYDDNEFVHIGCQNSFDDFLPFVEYREKVPLLIVQLTEKDVKQKSVYQSSKMLPKKKTVQVPEINYTQKLSEPTEYFQGFLDELKQFEIGMLNLVDRKDWKHWKNQHQRFGQDFNLLLSKRSQKILAEWEEIQCAKQKVDSQTQSPAINSEKQKLSKKEAEKLLDDQFKMEIQLKKSLKKQLKKGKQKSNDRKLSKDTQKSKDIVEDHLSFDSNISSDEIVDEKPPIPKIVVPQTALEGFGVLELSDKD